jgi:predicted DNA-binding protein
MEVHLTPELEAQLNQLAAQTGRPKDELVQDAMAGFFAEMAEARQMLDSRYDEVKSGQVKPRDGDGVIAQFQQKSQERRRNRS